MAIIIPYVSRNSMSTATENLMSDIALRNTSFVLNNGIFTTDLGEVGRMCNLFLLDKRCLEFQFVIWEQIYICDISSELGFYRTLG